VRIALELVVAEKYTVSAALSEEALRPARAQTVTRRVLRDDRVKKEPRGIIVLVQVISIRNCIKALTAAPDARQGHIPERTHYHYGRHYLAKPLGESIK
jgi:hypothetical protein